MISKNFYLSSEVHNAYAAQRSKSLGCKMILESKFQKLVVEENNSLTCIICAYIAKKPSDMKRHLEKHIDGLSYDCQFCEKTFRSSSSLRVHCHTKHGTKNK